MTAGSQAAGGRSSRAGAREHRRTPAQWYCLLAGLSLLLAGILGFFADASFTTGDGIDGDRLLSIFEVNGIHNLVHIASGLVLLAASPKRASAKRTRRGFWPSARSPADSWAPHGWSAQGPFNQRTFLET